MTTKKRGRPLGSKGKHRQILLHPPEHIVARIVARNRSISHHWQEVLVDMDRYATLIENFRKSHRLTYRAVVVLLGHPEEEIPNQVIEDVLFSVPSWKKTGSLGGSVAAKKRRQWEEVVNKNLNTTLARHTAARAASLMLQNWPDFCCQKPCDRSLRDYLSKLRKISGK
jgi:hypothetical protein